MLSLRKRRYSRLLAGCVMALTLLGCFVYLCTTSICQGSQLVSGHKSPSPPRQLLYKGFTKRRKYAKPFGYIINEEALCQEHGSSDIEVDYLFMVFSAVSNVDRRNAIRGTWGRDVKTFSSNRLAFLLGNTNDAILKSAVESESSVHKDLIQEGFTDSYRNVTLKSIMMLHWASTYCSKARFVVKVDDDTYVNVANLFGEMLSRPIDAIYGKLFQSSQPIRDLTNKWYVTEEEYADSVYPDYVGGSAYMVGGGVVNALYRATGDVKPFPIEDAYLTGSCAETAGVRRVHVDGFNTLKIESLCDIKNALTAHYTTATEMVVLWDQLQRTKFVCHRIFFDIIYFCRCKTSAIT